MKDIRVNGRAKRNDENVSGVNNVDTVKLEQPVRAVTVPKHHKLSDRYPTCVGCNIFDNNKFRYRFLVCINS